jgi:hypothetical protein
MESLYSVKENENRQGRVLVGRVISLAALGSAWVAPGKSSAQHLIQSGDYWLGLGANLKAALSRSE